MKQILTGVVNKMGLLNLIVTGQKENLIRISIHGNEQWVGEGDSFHILNDEWVVKQINNVPSDSSRILVPNNVIAVVSQA